jgi:hypothetical protein
MTQTRVQKLVFAGVKVWLDNCYIGTIWLYVFFLWLFNGWIKVLHRVYRVLDGGGKETYGLEI